MKRLSGILTLLLLLTVAGTQRVHAFSFALDSIAAMGKVPRAAINVYRWGDRFFNTYDSTYVVGTGYKFNVKARTETWQDYYGFILNEDTRLDMVSDPCTSMGFYVTYLALSLGYDLNISKYLGADPRARKRFNFGFTCSLLAADFYFISNDVGTRINYFGTPEDHVNPDLHFNGINCSSWGVETYYFFNHKKYSQAAAFSYSKIQKRSAGSFFAGISYSEQNYKFDFSDTPDYIKDELPESWGGYTYRVLARNYALKIGYGHNFVFPHNWVLGISEAPMVGIRHGYINNPNEERVSFAFSNRLRAGAAYNHNNRLFVGLNGELNLGFIRERDHSLLNMNWTFSASVGYRFNIW